MLSLSALNGEAHAAMSILGSAHRDIANLLHDLPVRSAPDIARDGLIESLRRMLDKEYAGAFDAVRWEIAPECEAAFATLPTLPSEVLYYAAREAVRNAAKHGRSLTPLRPLHLTIGATLTDHGDGVRLSIADDGVGLTGRLPTSDGPPPPGSGNGLALHSTMMAVIGGLLTIESCLPCGTRVELSVPLTVPLKTSA
jgi:signal transduction histidine kinase